MNKPDIESIRQSPRQYVDLETVEALSDYAMLLEQQLVLLRTSLDSANQIITFEGVPYYLLGIEDRDEVLAAIDKEPKCS